jgi:Divergent InlB B-repeat domain
MTTRARRASRIVIVLATLGILAGAAGENARAAPWCGTTTTQDRPPGLTGPSIHVVYAYPAESRDRSSELAPRISADVDEIDTWWRGQDPSREPRFDRAPFTCGLQPDLFVLRVGTGAGGTANRILASLPLTDSLVYEKHLVFYDGMGDDPTICGEGGTDRSGRSVAIVYLAACPDISSAVIGAHELLHAFGALPAGAPHACPSDGGHPCDTMLDILYPYASPGPLGGFALDAGRDDYYGHAGSWLDVQDSPWLRLVGQQVQFTVAITGKGNVGSAVPGIDCDASCSTDWDTGSVVSLDARAAEGQRFVRWSGSCTGSGACEVTLAAAMTVGALFAPERYGLLLSLTGKGTVSGAGSPCRVSRCQRSATSFSPLRLQATAAAGWRFVGWNGGCVGRVATCTVPMTKATSVRARFVRR